MIARYKPQQPIIVVTSHEHTARKAALVYGCFPIVSSILTGSKQVVVSLAPLLKKERVIEKGDRMVVTAGVPFGKAGTTNMMMILTAH